MSASERLERLRRRQETEETWTEIGKLRIFMVFLLTLDLDLPPKEMIENWRVKNEANFKKAEQKKRENLGFRPYFFMAI